MSQCQWQGRAPAHGICRSWREKRSKFLHGQTTRNCNWLWISHLHRLGQRLSELCSVGHCLPGTAFCLCALERLSRRREDPLCLDHLPQPWGRRCKVPSAHWDLATSPERAQGSTGCFSVGLSYFSQKRVLMWRLHTRAHCTGRKKSGRHESGPLTDWPEKCNPGNAV